MANKRKRAKSAKHHDKNKRTRLAAATEGPSGRSFDHPVLSLYFTELYTLREYLAGFLAANKHGRRSTRKLADIDATTDAELATLLDSAVVGVRGVSPAAQNNSGSTSNVDAVDVDKEIVDATQSTSGSGLSSADISQSDLVDLVLQILFRRAINAPRGSKHAVYPGKPNHILALGYAIQSSNGGSGDPAEFHVALGPLAIPLVNRYPNSHVNMLKSQIWERLLRVIGDRAMFNLLLGTCVFMRVGEEADRRTYYQLSGPPISDALNDPENFVGSGVATAGALGKFQGHGPSVKRTASEIENPAKDTVEGEASVDLERKNTENTKIGERVQVSTDFKAYGHGARNAFGVIVFVRSRMFYARPAYNNKGQIRFGLRHIHVLNRFPHNAFGARDILKYLFPRQHDLHNVFTSTVDRKTTVQPLHDYTLREKEIHDKGKALSSVPRRLKAAGVLPLVEKMQKLHKSCPYHALVKHYCPALLCDSDAPDKRVLLHGQQLNDASAEVLERSDLGAHDIHASTLGSGSTTAVDQVPVVAVCQNSRNERFTKFASSAGEVSGFVKAVVNRVIPNEFFGNEDNKKTLISMVDRFVKLRRYESFSLHDVMQGLKLTEIDWLRPPSVRQTQKMSRTDVSKRRELLAEFVYWFFDSFLIPLLRSHFYVTESGVDRNRIFYFRHDVWKRLSEPALNKLKLNMFREMKGDQALQILGARSLGFVQVRLLPKDLGVRPLMNLKRRGTIVLKNGQTRLAPSINTVMTPVFNVLAFEKSRKPEQMGSSMFSVNEMYPRMKEFQTRIAEKGWQGKKLYFAKVDVQACFDTIPQERLLRLIEGIMEEEEYRANKYVEVRPPAIEACKSGMVKPTKRVVTQARPSDEMESFAKVAEKLAAKLKLGAVLVDDVVGKPWETHALLKLLRTHIKENIIKIGKKYYKQKMGIPQGSVISSILCNFFYADLEREKLPFIAADDCLLLRLVDDSLLITLDHTKAIRFLDIMISGNPEYGAEVNADKSLVNFEIAVNGKKIPRLVGTKEFPYCGTVIDTQTLDVRRDRERRRGMNIDDTLTVEYSRRPGSTLLRKVVDSFKIQSHAMFLDTDFNSIPTVLQNLYHALIECAMKFHRYVRSLQRGRRKISGTVMVRAVKELLETAWAMLKTRQKGKGGDIVRSEVVWLGARAFRRCLGRKQCSYWLLLKWLQGMEKEGRRPKAVGGLRLQEFRGARY